MESKFGYFIHRYLFNFSLYHETLFYLFLCVCVPFCGNKRGRNRTKKKIIVLKKIYSKNILHTCEIQNKQRAKKNHIISVALFINVCITQLRGIKKKMKYNKVK